MVILICRTIPGGYDLSIGESIEKISPSYDYYHNRLDSQWRLYVRCICTERMESVDCEVRCRLTHAKMITCLIYCFSPDLLWTIGCHCQQNRSIEDQRLVARSHSASLLYLWLPSMNVFPIVTFPLEHRRRLYKGNVT